MHGGSARRGAITTSAQSWSTTSMTVSGMSSRAGRWRRRLGRDTDPEHDLRVSVPWQQAGDQGARPWHLDHVAHHRGGDRAGRGHQPDGAHRLAAAQPVERLVARGREDEVVGEGVVARARVERRLTAAGEVPQRDRPGDVADQRLRRHPFTARRSSVQATRSRWYGSSRSSIVWALSAAMARNGFCSAVTRCSCTPCRLRSSGGARCRVADRHRAAIIRRSLCR